jgi:hypothetical protein
MIKKRYILKIRVIRQNGWQAAAGSSIVNRLRMLTHLSAAARKKSGQLPVCRTKKESAKNGKRGKGYEQSKAGKGISSH